MPGGIFYAAVAVYAGLNLSIKSALFFPPLVLFIKSVRNGKGVLFV